MLHSFSIVFKDLLVLSKDQIVRFWNLCFLNFRAGLGRKICLCLYMSWSVTKASQIENNWKQDQITNSCRDWSSCHGINICVLKWRIIVCHQWIPPSYQTGHLLRQVNDCTSCGGKKYIWGEDGDSTLIISGNKMEQFYLALWVVFMFSF